MDNSILTKRITVYYVEHNGIRKPYNSKRLAGEAVDTLNTFGVTDTTVTKESRTVKLDV